MPKPSRTEIRRLGVDDSVDQITQLLHRAYARNAAMGLHFLATHQAPAITAERLQEGDSFVAIREGRVVGTITAHIPQSVPYGSYEPPGPIASFGQFAVDPAHRSLGIGDMLLAEVENLSLDAGCNELALDTAKPATGLLAYYEARGFQIVGSADWRPAVNYESWILSKTLEH